MLLKAKSPSFSTLHLDSAVFKFAATDQAVQQNVEMAKKPNNTNCSDSNGEFFSLYC